MELSQSKSIFLLSTEQPNKACRWNICTLLTFSDQIAPSFQLRYIKKKFFNEEMFLFNDIFNGGRDGGRGLSLLS